jgi:hypothetical protein
MQFLIKTSDEASPFFGAMLLAGMLAAFGGQHASAQDNPCPWVVQPNEPIVGLGADTATYDISFTGLEDREILYGFTVTDHQLALRLTREGKLADLSASAEPLSLLEQEDAIVYQLSADSILPKTIYLAVATSRVDELEQIDARIEPPRPVSVGMLTRGASDHTGPLPHRSVPGIEIIAMPAEAERLLSPISDQGIQLCAYQVSWR